MLWKRIEEVEDRHTYFVGDECVLVHNACSKADVLAANRKQGRDYEKQQFAEIKKQYPNAVEQVTIVTPDGTRLRMDAVALDDSGNILLFEFKSSETAPFTNNQNKAYVKKGFNLPNGGAVKGSKPGLSGLFPNGEWIIPPGTKVDVIRP